MVAHIASLSLHVGIVVAPHHVKYAGIALKLTTWLVHMIGPVELAVMLLVVAIGCRVHQEVVLAEGVLDDAVQRLVYWLDDMSRLVCWRELAKPACIVHHLVIEEIDRPAIVG